MPLRSPLRPALDNRNSPKSCGTGFCELQTAPQSPGAGPVATGGHVLKKNFAFASIVSLLTFAACAPSAPLSAPTITGAAGDWPSYNRTLPGDRFSPLAEISRSNVAQLRSLCTYTLPEVTSLQTGPIVVGGTMFFTTDTISYAIDAASCASNWKQVRHSSSPSGLLCHPGLCSID